MHETKTYGLLMKEKGIYCSADGVIDVKLPGCISTKLVLVEFETKVAFTTVNEAVTVHQNMDHSCTDHSWNVTLIQTSAGQLLDLIDFKYCLMWSLVVSQMSCMWLEVKVELFTFISSYF